MDEISRTVARGAHAVLLLDRAGWHTTVNLKVPTNMTFIFLPLGAPELNRVENVWQHLRQTWPSNRVFDTYEAIIEAACEAWNRLMDQPQAKVISEVNRIILDVVARLAYRVYGHIHNNIPFFY